MSCVFAGLSRTFTGHLLCVRRPNMVHGMNRKRSLLSWGISPVGRVSQCLCAGNRTRWCRLMISMKEEAALPDGFGGSRCQVVGAGS